MGGDLACELELEYAAVCGRGCGADGLVGEEEGDQAEEGVPRKVQGKKVDYAAGYLLEVVCLGDGEMDAALALSEGCCGRRMVDIQHIHCCRNKTVSIYQM